jgi:hypothetical protein
MGAYATTVYLAAPRHGERTVMSLSGRGRRAAQLRQALSTGCVEGVDGRGDVRPGWREPWRSLVSSCARLYGDERPWGWGRRWKGRCEARARIWEEAAAGASAPFHRRRAEWERGWRGLPRGHHGMVPFPLTDREAGLGSWCGGGCGGIRTLPLMESEA